jgi:predicted RND superfamily exporter protein
MFASMVLGIGVDFSIHLSERYRRLRDDGMEHDGAVVETLAATGPAILVNALALGLGLGVLVLSRVPANAQLGTITVVSLAGCLVATLLVMPAALRAADSRRPRA